MLCWTPKCLCAMSPLPLPSLTMGLLFKILSWSTTIAPSFTSLLDLSTSPTRKKQSKIDNANEFPELNLEEDDDDR